MQIERENIIPEVGDRKHISPEAFAIWRDERGRLLEYLKRPDGLWGWRTVIGKEWCAPVSELEYIKTKAQELMPLPVLDVTLSENKAAMREQDLTIYNVVMDGTPAGREGVQLMVTIPIPGEDRKRVLDIHLLDRLVEIARKQAERKIEASS